MQQWYHILPKHTGLGAYIWIVFCVLPFFFIFRSSSVLEIVFGILMTFIFFLCYRWSFSSNSRMIYLFVSIEIAISLLMTFLFGYVYFALFLAYFIGSIRHRGGFIALYTVHLTTTFIATVMTFIMQMDSLFPYLPFVTIALIGVVLLPFTVRYRRNQEILEDALEDANERISQLVVTEERERIARDLHDTLGQKLSMIGLKSELAGKLIEQKPDQAKDEMRDIHDTARTALKEVREMVSDMRVASLEDEWIRARQMIETAGMNFEEAGAPGSVHLPPLIEHVLSMCLKEAVTNVTRHSNASVCQIAIDQGEEDTLLTVTDDGDGFSKDDYGEGSGLKGMKERLEFVNGTLKIEQNAKTALNFYVPTIIKQKEELS
ncbi:sensor histidine kinase [Salimicrobium jeotgali]|uniref:histidine kinase n=1 Tax=Salimicrobium jeotgali TaxID=1230341 RepID=K2GAE8_9BACI|nr:sensor histidine kinase [Salimicrobium jeotgali]AKG03557.1 sensor histidine kinase [Salimicrobium jeotgali]EKE32048.1 two-component sensor histidine kinase [Salimicrobium jeotgali]MBM7696015.1 two-component system sensor histidine kinase DesK [Salimicrobium jeotgali]